MLSDRERKFWLDEFSTFSPPFNFKGGCIRTRGKTESGQSICVLLKSDGTIGEIREGCEHEMNCKGQVFKYLP